MTRHLCVLSTLVFFCLGALAEPPPPTYQAYGNCRQKCAQTYHGETEDGAFCRVTCNTQYPDAATEAYAPHPILPPPPPPGFVAESVPDFGSGVNGQLNVSIDQSTILMILLVLQSFRPSPRYSPASYFPAQTGWPNFGPDPMPLPLPAPYGFGALEGGLSAGTSPALPWPNVGWPY